MPSTSNVGLSGNLDIDGVLGGIKWTNPNLTFAFPTSMSLYSYSETGFEAMNDAQKAAVRSILSMYSTYTNLTFTEVTATDTTAGTLRFAEEDSAGTAYAYYPSSGDWGGDVWLNHNDYNNPLKGTYAWATFMHEIGHAVGLDHGQDGLAALPTNHDSLEYSVMTYRSFVGADLNGYTVMQGSYPTTLMLDDIAALQYMYGANYTTNGGDTVYKWSATTGELSINSVGQGASTTNTIFMTLWDGGGNDTYDFSNYATNLKVDLSPGGWTTTASSQLANLGGYWYANQYARGNIANAYLYNGNTASLIENAIGGSGNDTISGNQAANTLTGNGGNDTLYGLDGNDTLIGGLGNDIMDGGNGTDTCVIAANFADCFVTYNSSTLTYLISSAAGGSDQLTNIELVTFLDGTRNIADTLPTTPDTTAPTLTGTTPADNAGSVAVGANIVLTFSEAVTAGAGTISIYNGTGSLLTSIAASNSGLVSYNGATVTINPSADLAAGQSYYVNISGSAFHDASGNYYGGLTGSTAFNFTTAVSTINGTSAANSLVGTASNDTIYGLGGNDTIRGNGGDDTIDGGAGSDTMYGGAGNDTYIVDSTGDLAIENASEGTDTVRSGVTFTLGSNIENLVLTGSSAVNGTGNTLDNQLTGNSAINTLSGGLGNDRIDGLGGSDTLTGGAGKDTFVFSTAPSAINIDKITDFSVIDDTIALSVSVFKALSIGSLSAADFVIGARAGDASDRIIYNSSTGALYYDADGSGSGAAQQIASLSKGLALTAADFLLVA